MTLASRPKDECTMFFQIPRNSNKTAASRPRRTESSAKPPWKPQI